MDVTFSYIYFWTLLVCSWLGPVWTVSMNQSFCYFTPNQMMDGWYHASPYLQCILTMAVGMLCMKKSMFYETWSRKTGVRFNLKKIIHGCGDQQSRLLELVLCRKQNIVFLLSDRFYDSIRLREKYISISCCLIKSYASKQKSRYAKINSSLLACRAQRNACAFRLLFILALFAHPCAFRTHIFAFHNKNSLDRDTMLY